MVEREVPLCGRKAEGRVALVDDADYALVCGFRWYVWERVQPGRRPWGPYAYTIVGRKHVYMHKLISGFGRTDHVNHDGLDNRRLNLRPATTAQNTANQRPQCGRTSRFKGVCWNRAVGKWQANIKVGGKTYYLGVFACEEEAARAYDAAALAAWGEYAYAARDLDGPVPEPVPGFVPPRRRLTMTLSTQPAKLTARRAEFARLREAGSSVPDAGSAVGASRKTARRYEQFRLKEAA